MNYKKVVTPLAHFRLSNSFNVYGNGACPIERLTDRYVAITIREIIRVLLHSGKTCLKVQVLC